MKPASKPDLTKDDSEHDDSEPTPTQLAEAFPKPSPRPSLVRSSPGRLSDISEKLARIKDHETEGRSANTGDDAGEQMRTMSRSNSAKQSSQAKVEAASMEEERLGKLRDGMNAKLLLQQCVRRSYGSAKPEMGQVHISPIPEEEGQGSGSSAVHASFTTPPTAMRTSSTVSSQSTESTRTIRAGTPAGDVPARTPSYPFPYVPGTPKTWSSHFHQPFTTLSPTATGMPSGEDDTPGKSSIISAGSTPGPEPPAFLPPGSMTHGSEDPRFPSPNLYDLVLQLNAEPGMEQWWSTVTNLMHDHFKADRATLVVPMDPTDIEDVPWGQKATFNMNGPEEFVSHRTVLEQMAAASNHQRMDFAYGDPSITSSAIKPQKLHPERLRPRLEARHSYAGHGRDEALPKTSSRPPGPQRTVTHAAGVSAGIGLGRLPPQRFPSASTVRQGSLDDLEYSSFAGGVDSGPYAEVFTTLRALDQEAQPLIEPGGVNRVLNRGRLVAVTRDYVQETSSSSDSNKDEPMPPDRKSTAEKVFGNYRSVFAADNGPSMLRDYEEYEQYPTSPWSQSPAPSPAIQANEDTNPFFASEEQQVEDSFDPATSPKDYSQLGQVEAIGIEQASTVIHIPLVHPTMSQPMQSLRTYVRSKDGGGPPKRSNTIDLERKAPIAILSVLCSAVPYPHNLSQSLKLLGPHLATSFAISQQFSAARSQAITIRHRRTASGRNVNNAPMTIEPTTLDEIVKSGVQGPHGSVSGSVTSPSDYSGPSKSSPNPSIVGTPGWDPATHGWTSSKSVTGTPSLTGSEIVDNYFESKKRSGPRSTSSTSGQAQTTPARPARQALSSEIKQSVRKPSPPADDDMRSAPGDWNANNGTAMKDQRSSLRRVSGKDHSPTRSAEASSPQRPFVRAMAQITDSSKGRSHSQLHSYGADFLASFGGLPSPVAEPRTAGTFAHGRKPSYPEDMPPPSERLLRTIIDSVPVQIFTAEPESGNLTWVNSKFMIYRGQEARQVLDEPWQAIHADDRNEFLSSWHRSLRTAQQLQQKVRLERFDGTYRWFYVRAAPLKDKRQKIVHWIGTMMDFHEQHTAEVNSTRQQETAASEAKYRALANSSPQIVFAANRTKGVTFCNTQWVHFSGQPESQALDVGFMDHVHPDDLAKCRLPSFEEGSDVPRNVPTSVPPDLKRKPSAAVSSSSGSTETEKGPSSPENSPLNTQMPQRKLSELASTGILRVARDADGRPSYSTEVRLKSKDGEYRWHLVRVLLAEPLLQSNHSEETWYGTCTDINDHKTLERELKETMDEKSRFLSNMSHEIRTPLNGISGMVNFLIDSSLTAEQMEHVNIIRASTEGLRGLINDILDLSKAEAGMIQLNMDWLFVRALIEEVNDLTSAMAIDKGLELNYLVEEDVPAQIKGDRFRIRQILLNIIGNAIKFTQKGEVFVRCSTQRFKDYELPEDELYIKFEVIDTGRGFTDEEAQYLFKRFSQIDGSSTRQHGGTGLGLVISRQLAQLHGGDMSAKGVPGKGATFTLSIRTTLPSLEDQPPPPPLPTPSATGLPSLPMSPGPVASPMAVPKPLKKPSFPMTMGSQARPSPKFTIEQTQSPSPYMSPDIGRESPSASSASSYSSVRSPARTSSLRSERSSASSFVPEPSLLSGPPFTLALPTRAKGSEGPESKSTDSAGSAMSDETVKASSGNIITPVSSPVPPMYSILVLCPLKYAREATVQHIDNTLPKNIPHQITARASLAECQDMIGSQDPVIFTHIVAVLQEVDDITALIDQVLSSRFHHSTHMVLITDLAQKRKIMEKRPKYDYDQLASERRLRFVFKPLKPSRFAIIFDPQKEREMSTDRNQDSAHQVALTQKQVFEQVAKRLGNRDKRVLLVEDNRTNQLVILKFLAKVSMTAETAADGVECINKVFSHPYGYYSVILCDLFMPNKDGYQTCKEIRQWERENHYPHLPIVALSANVLGDVYQKCVDAGFNSYMTKPVDFKELSAVLMAFMDPSDPSKPHEFMKLKRRQSATPRR